VANAAPAAPAAPAAAPASSATPTPTGATVGGDAAGASADIPIEVDIDGTPKFQPGESFAVEVKTSKDAVCELAVKWPNDQEDNEDSKTADSRGRCRFNIQVPDNMQDGSGKVKGWARISGKYNRADSDFEIKKK
jgi:hypothetical protein